MNSVTREMTREDAVRAVDEAAQHLTRIGLGRGTWHGEDARRAASDMYELDTWSWTAHDVAGDRGPVMAQNVKDAGLMVLGRIDAAGFARGGKPDADIHGKERGERVVLVRVEADPDAHEMVCWLDIFALIGADGRVIRRADDGDRTARDGVLVPPIAVPAGADGFVDFNEWEHDVWMRFHAGRLARGWSLPDDADEYLRYGDMAEDEGEDGAEDAA